MTQAIIIYAVTFLSPSQNWLYAIGKNDSDQVSQYIYSIYFIGTTMLTVGYGDILPINNFQIILILFIQVLGMASIMKEPSWEGTSSVRLATSLQP